MKKKIIQSALLAFTAILMVAPQAMALEIFVDNYGNVKFYQSQVLGNSNDKQMTTGGVKQAGSNKDEDTDSYNSRERVEIRESAPIKTLNASSRQRIEFSSDDQVMKVEVKDSVKKTGTNNTTVKPETFTNKDEIKTNEINFSFPTSSRSQKTTQELDDYFKDQFTKRTNIQKLDEEARKKALEKSQEEYKKNIEKLQEERKTKTEERVEIRSNYDQGQGERFEIQSRDIKAKLEGANFAYDQDSEDVILTTPSGQEHILQHLPDEAIERMTENGFFINKDQEIEITTTDDGQVKYIAPSQRNKRFLGLFNRQVNTEVALDDLTGEVVETEIPTTSPLDRLLNYLSF